MKQSNSQNQKALRGKREKPLKGSYGPWLEQRVANGRLNRKMPNERPTQNSKEADPETGFCQKLDYTHDTQKDCENSAIKIKPKQGLRLEARTEEEAKNPPLKTSTESLKREAGRRTTR